MQHHTRAMIAASAHALVTGRKVAGLYRHAAERHLRVAAEARVEHLQGSNGERALRFGGTLPQLSGGVHIEVEGTTARGYDRNSSAHFTAGAGERLAQLYDHAEGTWFSFQVQVA